MPTRTTSSRQPEDGHGLVGRVVSRCRRLRAAPYRARPANHRPSSVAQATTAAAAPVVVAAAAAAARLRVAAGPICERQHHRSYRRWSRRVSRSSNNEVGLARLPCDDGSTHSLAHSLSMMRYDANTYRSRCRRHSTCIGQPTTHQRAHDQLRERYAHCACIRTCHHRPRSARQPTNEHEHAQARSRTSPSARFTPWLDC